MFAFDPPSPAVKIPDGETWTWCPTGSFTKNRDAIVQCVCISTCLFFILLSLFIYLKGTIYIPCIWCTVPDYSCSSFASVAPPDMPSQGLHNNKGFRVKYQLKTISSGASLITLFLLPSLQVPHFLFYLYLPVATLPSWSSSSWSWCWRRWAVTRLSWGEQRNTNSGSARGRAAAAAPACHTQPSHGKTHCGHHNRYNMFATSVFSLV